MQVYADDLIGRHLLISGQFDRSVVNVLLDCARPGDVLVDIGANVGYVSACFLNKIQDGEAYCIEPQPGVIDLLRKNLAQFDGRAQVFQTALGEEDGELRFQINQQNRGKSRIKPNGDTVVAVRQAAGLFGSFPKVNLIKIDVEPIFRSLEPELLRLKPRAILFEDQAGEAAPKGEIGVILGRTGYTTFGIEKRLMATRLRPIRSRSDCKFNDYLAVSQSCGDSAP